MRKLTHAGIEHAIHDAENWLEDFSFYLRCEAARYQASHARYSERTQDEEEAARVARIMQQGNDEVAHA